MASSDSPTLQKMVPFSHQGLMSCLSDVTVMARFSLKAKYRVMLDLQTYIWTESDILGLESFWIQTPPRGKMKKTPPKNEEFKLSMAAHSPPVRSRQHINESLCSGGPARFPGHVFQWLLSRSLSGHDIVYDPRAAVWEVIEGRVRVVEGWRVVLLLHVAW